MSRMTREDAIESFKKSVELCEARLDVEKMRMDIGEIKELEFYIERDEMAIKALSQEPCDDAISRDFQIGDEVRMIGSDPIYDDCDVGWVIRNASEKVKTMYVMRNDGSADEENKAEWYKTGRHNAVIAEVIKALPSVTQKSGKWIITHLSNMAYCSECDYLFKDIPASVVEHFKYCPNCGVKMESEDKE